MILKRLVYPDPSAPIFRLCLERYYDALKWFAGFLLVLALLLSGYAVYRAKKAESADKPQVRSIAAVARH